MKRLALLLMLAASAASTPARAADVTFRVDMRYWIERGAFNPDRDFVDVAGTFNGWGGTLTRLSDADGDRIYEVTVGGFAVSTVIEYKFRFNGAWGGREEFPGAGNNRRYTVGPGANVILVWYNDEAPPTGPPVAAFTAAARTLSAGGVAYFSDRSAGAVERWAWTFEGGVPATSSERNPAVRYARAGTFGVTLVASGPDGSDTLAAPGFVEVRERDVAGRSWWNDAVFYEVFVRSFSDSDGDGIGDFNGLTAKLDYLNDGDPNTTDDLGVTALWLMPIHASPSYHGYDVTDYRSVHPDYGTKEDFARLVREAHRRGIRVIIDFVVNHSSNRHPWFLRSAQGDPAYRDFYRWSATDPGYAGPWGQQVWHRSGAGYYYGVFWSGMPDLNYHTPAVRDSIFAAADYWLREANVDGFRLDAVKYVFEDGRALEDLPATHGFWDGFTQHVKRARPDAFTVCEAWTGTEAVLPYVNEGGLDACFEFDLASAVLGAAASGRADGLAARMQTVYDAYPHLQFGSFLTNHDQDRVMDVLGNDERKAKVAAALYLTLPGIPFVYYGEEIGMTGRKPDELIRRPMQWSGGPGAGFTTGTPWIAPGGNVATHNVARARADSASLLNLYRRLIGVRTRHAALRVGTYHAVPASHPAVMAFVREHEGESVLVVVNTSADAAGPFTLALPPGVVEPGPVALRDLLRGGPPSEVRVAASGVIEGATVAGYEARVYALGAGSTSSADDARPDADGFFLRQSYPNPAGSAATIVFGVPERGRVTLDVFNALGQRVRALVDAEAAPGPHAVVVDTNGLAPGVYHYRLRQGARSATMRLAVTR